LFDRLATRLLQLGPYGCRAVLWHQGESDTNQALVGRTLPGGQYRDSLEQIIRKSRERAGWEVPWFVAQASYHSPQDPGSPDIRAAQEALWVDGIALEGPDTDALTGDLRDNGGRGVHFSAKGLQVHGERWAEKVGAHLDKVLAKP
jgi:lysophospholipase L1-like esterase